MLHHSDRIPTGIWQRPQRKQVAVDADTVSSPITWGPGSSSAVSGSGLAERSRPLAAGKHPLASAPGQVDQSQRRGQGRVGKEIAHAPLRAAETLIILRGFIPTLLTEQFLECELNNNRAPDSPLKNKQNKSGVWKERRSRHLLYVPDSLTKLSPHGMR